MKELTVFRIASVSVSVSVLLKVIITIRRDLSAFVDPVVSPVGAKYLLIVVLTLRIGLRVADLLFCLTGALDTRMSI